MKTAVRQTSIDAYHGHDFTTQQKQVLQAIKALHETCIADVAAFLGWERSTVSGRMNDLKKADAIVCVGKRKSRKTGINSEHWRAKQFEECLFRYK